MSLLDPLISKIEMQFTLLRHRLLGVNNERLDFIMDSFYKLPPRRKNFALLGISLAIVFFIGFTVTFYLTQIGSLETRLSHSLMALQNLQQQKTQYGNLNNQFSVIVNEVNSKTQKLQMKPLMEKFARSLAIKIEGLNEADAAFSSDNPMGKYLTQKKIEVRFPRISIPKLLKFLVEVEKSRQFLRVSDLTIRGIYGTKLYFNATTVIHWYKGV